MTKLKLSAVPDDRPVKFTVDLPAGIHRDLALYAETSINCRINPIQDVGFSILRLAFCSPEVTAADLSV